VTPRTLDAAGIIKQTRSESGGGGDGGDDDAGLAAQGAAELSCGAVVQDLVPAVLDDQLGQDDRER